MDNIPKIIHYCWFGDNPKSKLIDKCINTWKEKLTEYTIIEWNEKNFDINMNNYVKKAYDEKKWAFVSDYARLYALYNYGGIYMDTDMEVLKSFTDISNSKFFIGCEQENIINAAIIGSNKNNKIIKEIMEYYDLKMNNYYRTIPDIVTEIFKKYGFVECNKIIVLNNGATIYPKEYFYPKDLITHRLNLTKNSYCIHHFDASWMTKYQKIRCYILSNCYNIYIKVIRMIKR